MMRINVTPDEYSRMQDMNARCTVGGAFQKRMWMHWVRQEFGEAGVRAAQTGATVHVIMPPRPDDEEDIIMVERVEGV